MSATVPDPLRAPAVEAPDRDFATARDDALAVVTAEAGATWTDHNAPDPGITLLEALAWGVADLHYRTARRGLGTWPLEVPVAELPAEPHWSGVPLAADPVALLVLADALASGPAAGPTVAQQMAAVIAGAGSSHDAANRLAGRTFATGGPALRPTWAQAVAAVRLLRGPVVLRGALDGSAAVAAAVEAAGADADEAIALLRFEPVVEGLWDDELAGLVRRERRRAVAALVADLEDTIAASGDSAALLDLLTDEHGLTADEAELALALHPCPEGVAPERWERAGGATRVWPPHPLQARTVEPITADDYARRARGAFRVRRAWAVGGIVLPGIGWDGRVVAAATPRVGAVTLLVEPEGAVTAGDAPGFLRAVLRSVLGPSPSAEVDDPFDGFWRATLDPAAPRRTICDEVGAALVRRCPITVKGTIYAPAGTDRAALLERARDRLAAFFAEGRPESRPAATPGLECPDGIAGSWPPFVQPESGWVPGEAIRLSELVQRLAEDPLVLGVEGLQLAIADGGWLPDPGITGHVPLPPDCVPVLAERRCMTVTLTIANECGHG